MAAARKIGVPDDRVASWEAGDTQPTIAQLRKAADVYKRTLAVFFLPAPPEDFDTLRDFRRHQGADAGAWSPGLHEDYRRAHFQRDQALELADLEEYEPPTTCPMLDASATRQMLADLGSDLHSRCPRWWRTLLFQDPYRGLSREYFGNKWVTSQVWEQRKL